MYILSIGKGRLFGQLFVPSSSLEFLTVQTFLLSANLFFLGSFWLLISTIRLPAGALEFISLPLP